MKRAQQGGAVLIMALLIVALVATLAVSYAGDMLLMQARAENRVLGAQQNAYMDGAVALAGFVLKEDANDGDIDHLDEIWAEPQLFPIEGGSLYGILEDAQSKINLNGLGNKLKDGGSATDPNRFDERQRRFIRFLQTFDGSQAKVESEEEPLVIDLNLAVAITEALVDWLDADDEPTGFGGAESLQYQQADKTWVPSNGEMQSLEELRLVEHVTPAIFEAIKPYLVVLPSDAELNINTLDVATRAPIIRSLNLATSLAPLALEDVQGYDSWRTGMADGYFATSADLAGQADLQARMGGGSLSTEGLAVNTAYFWLNVEVELGNRVANRRILLHRADGKIKVLAQFSSGQATRTQALASQTQVQDDEPEDKSDAPDNNNSQKRP